MCGRIETQHHYMYCKDEQYKLSQKNEWLALKFFLRHFRIHDGIRLIMWMGMKTWRNGESADVIDLPPIDDNTPLTTAIKEAYDQQSRIGWQHFFLGRLAKKWRRCISLGYRPDDEKADGKTEGCVRSIIESLWRMMLNIWKVRNDIEHGNNKSHSSRDIRILVELIDDLYDRFKDCATGDDEWILKQQQKLKEKSRL